MSINWAEIFAESKAEREAFQAQRERLRALEDRVAEREHRRRVSSAAPAVKREPPAPEPTREEKKKAARDALFAWVTQAQTPVADSPTTQEQPRAADGTFAPKPVAGTKGAQIIEREARERARDEEYRAAAAGLDKWLGRGVR